MPPTRWGPLAAALLLGSALVVSASLNYRDVKTAARHMAVSEGVAMFQRMHLDLNADDAALKRALAKELEAHEARYLAVWAAGRERAAAGDSRFPGFLPTPGELQVREERARMSFPGWLQKIHEYKPPTESWSRVLIMEFEPLEAMELTRRAYLALALASGAAVFLMSAAVVLWHFEQRAETLRADLEGQRELAHLGSMSAVLAHEIRNPLAVLKGHAQLMLENPRDARTAQRAERVVQAAVRLESLTNDLLDFVRSGAVRLAPTPPAQVLEAAALTTKPHRIELSLADAPASWPLDRVRMEQVLINLLENALNVTPEPERVSARVWVERGELVYTVRDRGPGVPASERSRVFDPFHTTNVHGTGLGLPVARRIVELHGGRIEIDDAPGGGAVFRARIPARSSVAPDARPLSSPLPLTPGRSA